MLTPAGWWAAPQTTQLDTQGIRPVGNLPLVLPYGGLVPEHQVFWPNNWVPLAPGQIA